MAPQPLLALVAALAGAVAELLVLAAGAALVADLRQASRLHRVAAFCRLLQAAVLQAAAPPLKLVAALWQVSPPPLVAAL